MMKIRLDGVSCSFDGRPALSDFSAAFGAEPVCWILGAEGAGKSTLGRVICGLVRPDTGRVLFDGEPLTGPVDHRQQSLRTGMVFQNPDEQFVAPTVERELAFGLENRGEAPAALRRNVDGALERWDLARHRFRPPRTLSGGEKQRLAMACMAIATPACLVLDEALDMMDAGSREAADRQLTLSLPAGTVLLRMTKHPEQIPAGERTIVLERGTVRYDGPADGQGWQEALHGIPGFTVPQLQAGGPVLPDAAPVLRTGGLGFAYDGNGAELYRQVSFLLHPGETAALTGPVGSGKTTLLSQLAGLLPVPAGTVHICGKDRREKDKRKYLAARVALVMQFPEQQFLTGTVREELLFTAVRSGLPLPEAEGRMARLAAMAGLPDDIYGLPPQGLRYSLRRLVAVVSALIHQPDLVLLDEPFTGLDWEGRGRVLALIRSQTEQGAAVLTVTHHPEIIRRGFNRVLEMKDGMVRERQFS